MKNNSAFTFVELIVVITILAILSAISIGTYQSYLSNSRDSNRLIQLKDIHDGLERYSINSRLPFPEDMIEIQSNGNTFAHQGYAGKGIINTIGYDGGGQDIEYGTYLTYMLSDTGRDFQLMTYIHDSSLLGQNKHSQVYAFQDYINMFPKVAGSPLGVLIDENTRAPIQELSFISNVGRYDIITGTGELIAYLYDKENIRNINGDDMTYILPNKSCRRIQEFGKSRGSGIYTINPDGLGNIRAYCDMETDGGGWTYAGFISSTASVNDIYFNQAFGGYDTSRTSSGSSYLLNLSDFGDTQALFLYNQKDIQKAEQNNNMLQLKYNEGLPGMNIGPLSSFTNASEFIAGYSGIEYRTKFDNEWAFTNKSKSGPSDWGMGTDSLAYIIRLRNSSIGFHKYSEVWGNTPSTSYNNEVWLYIR